jgi:hypothetical protein
VVLEYLRNYAEHFRVSGRLRLGVTVRSVRKRPGADTWEVLTVSAQWGVGELCLGGGDGP